MLQIHQIFDLFTDDFIDQTLFYNYIYCILLTFSLTAKHANVID